MTRYMIAAGILAAAGTAHAAPMIQILEDEWNWFAEMQVGFNGSVSSISGNEDTLFSPTGSRGDFFVGDPSDFGPKMDAIEAGVSINTAYNAATGLSMQTSIRSLIEMNAPIDPNDFDDAPSFGVSQAQVGGGVRFVLTENALVRIAVNGDAVFSDNVATEFGHRVIMRQLTGVPSLATFEAGEEFDEFGQMPLPLDFTLSLAAGEYEIELGNAIREDLVDPTALSGWSHEASLGFSFEIVPAPGAAALFGLAGLTATRRRR